LNHGEFDQHRDVGAQRQSGRIGDSRQQHCQRQYLGLFASADRAGQRRVAQVGGVFIGTGTTLADVRRVYNSYLDAQLQTTTSLNGDAQAYLDQIGTVDKLLSDKNTGVSAALSSFFASLQTAAAAPGDNSARQLLLTIAHRP
jgi:flagellar hook-associated protein FlgK